MSGIIPKMLKIFEFWACSKEFWLLLQVGVTVESNSAIKFATINLKNIRNIKIYREIRLYYKLSVLRL